MKPRKNLLALSLFFFAIVASAQAQPAGPLDDEAFLARFRAAAQKNGTSLTPEQEQGALQQYHMVLDRVRGGMQFQQMGAAPIPAPAIHQTTGSGPSAPAQTDEQLGREVAALPPRPQKFVVAERMDGFSVNGKGYVDPEGRIRSYAIDPIGGLTTYIAEAGSSSFTVKIARAGTSAEPITIASASRNGSKWVVTTSSGKTISGDTLTPLAGGGLLVARQQSAFIYRPGRGVRSISVPEQYVVASFQRGDVLNTDYLLLEKATDKTDALASAFNSIRSIGAALGAKITGDYALLNTATDELVTINVMLAGKDVATYSNCQRQNSYMNKCRDASFNESLYDNTGRNPQHYYWRIYWFSTPTGPILVSLENGTKNVTVRDMRTGKKVLAFDRALGIAFFDAMQDSEGLVHLQATLGFSKDKIDDAAAFLASAPAMAGATEAIVSQDDVKR